MMHTKRFYFLFLIFGVSLCPAQTIVVTLASGERLIGEELPNSSDSHLVLKSLLLGEVSLDRKQIQLVESNLSAESAQVAAQSPKPEPKPKAKPKSKALELSQTEEAHSDERQLLETVLNLKAPSSWSGNLRLGVNLSQGDSKWVESFSKGSLIIDPKSDPNYYRFNGSYTYRETERNDETVVSTDRYDGTFIYRRDFATSWFFQNSVGGRVDNIKGIDHDIQELVGVGYRYKPVDDLELIVGGGGGVEDFESEFEDTRNGFNPVVNFFQEFSWEPFEKAKVVQEFNYFTNPDKADQYNFLLTASFRYRLTDLFGFEFSYTQDLDNDIGDGNQKEDIRWNNAIILYF